MQLPAGADASGDEWSGSHSDSFTWDPVASHGFLQGSRVQQNCRSANTGPVTRDVGGNGLAADDSSMTWRCAACSSWDWRRTAQGIYECTCCGGTDFVSASSTSSGQWVWIPSQEVKTVTPGFDFDPEPSTKPADNRSVGPAKFRKPNDPGSEKQEAREQAESEVATNDPVVDPDTLQPVGRLSRRKRRAARRDAVPQQRAQNVSNASTSMNPAGDKAQGGSSGSSWQRPSINETAESV